MGPLPIWELPLALAELRELLELELTEWLVRNASGPPRSARITPGGRRNALTSPLRARLAIFSPSIKQASILEVFPELSLALGGLLHLRRQSTQLLKHSLEQFGRDINGSSSPTPLGISLSARHSRPLVGL